MVNTYFCKKNKINCGVFFTITTPSNKPWFWQFFEFSRKTGDFFRYFFDTMYNIMIFIFQFFPGGTNNFSLETLQKRHRNSNFLNIYLIGKWEYEPWCEINRLRRWWQNFWASTNFATFLSKNSSLHIESYGYINVASWRNKSGVHENFFKGRKDLQNKTFVC